MWIDYNGKIVIPLKLDAYIQSEFQPRLSAFKDGLAVVSKSNNKGVIDTKGEIVIPFKYEDLSGFSEGFSIVKKGNKYGYINKRNELIIPYTYDNAFDFSY